MKLTNRLFASTALIISVAATPLYAANLRPSIQGFEVQANTLPIISVQMSVSDARMRLEAAMAALAEAQANDGDVAAAKAEAGAAQAAVDAAMAAEAKTEAPAPEPVVEAPVAAEPVEKPVEAEKPAPEAAPAEEAAPVAEPAPVEKAPVAAEPVEKPADPTPVQEQPVEEEAPVEEKPAIAAPSEKTAEEQPAAEQPTAEQPTEEEAPAEEAPEEKVTPVEKPAPVEESAPATEEAPATEVAPVEEKPETEPAPVEKKTEAEQDAGAEASAKATAESKVEVTPEAKLPVEGGAPVLDSAKEATPVDGEAAVETEAKADTTARKARPAPKSDADSQAEVVQSEDIAAPLAEEGQRLEAAPARRPRGPDEGKVVQETNNRFVIQFNNQIIVENNDRERIRQRSNDVYYEELPRGRTREVITRRNGVQIVTVRDRYGEIVRRSKIMPDGRVILLAYVPEDDREDRRPWYDPGQDLPPLYLTIPIGEYVLDATVAQPGQFYEFLEQAPVEQVERIYSVDEVKHSARIRDKVRRIDMDTLTFEFGSAQIARDQVNDLAGLADAMEKILEDNPGETFLIEGHTDAVGSPEDNLILSDERAESVAIALSSVYGIPPENLATQGYGERYLKVRTEAPERLNRRVTIRRITPLVTPVASR